MLNSFMLQRLLAGLAMVVVVIVLNFLLLSAAPGDIVDVLATQAGGATAEQLEEIRREMGLDRNIFVQLGSYVSQVFQGNLGYSLFYNESVSDLILERLPNTLVLVLPAMLIAVVLGAFLGVISAYKPRGLLNHIVTLFSLIGFAAPVFWSGMVLLIVFPYSLLVACSVLVAPPVA